MSDKNEPNPMEIPETCHDVQNALHLFVGVDLEPQAQAAVERHLDGCSACRLLADDARGARDAFMTLAEDLPVTDSVWGDVRAQLEREGHLRGAPVAQRTPWWIIPAAAAASVAAVLITLAVTGGSSRLPGPLVGPAPSQPIVLHPVDGDVAPLFEPSSPVHPSVSGASAAGNPSRRMRPPIDANEIIR